MGNHQSEYRNLNRLEPWLCVDLEINPDTRKLIQAGILYKLKGQPAVSKTFNGESEKDFLKAVKQLLTEETTLIGHNLWYVSMRFDGFSLELSNTKIALILNQVR